MAINYNPINRILKLLDKPISKEGNIIYVKKSCMTEIENCLLSAPPAFNVKGWSM